MKAQPTNVWVLVLHTPNDTVVKGVYTSPEAGIVSLNRIVIQLEQSGCRISRYKNPHRIFINDYDELTLIKSVLGGN